MPSHDEPLKLFYSYAHEDEELRDALAQHLSTLKRQGVISAWHDREISAGEEWRGAINDQLEDAQIVLLLISPAFIASDYCYDKEMMRAMERHESGEARVIPVVLRPVDWQGTPFSELQALPRNAKPVTTWPNRDEAFADIAREIRLAAESVAPPMPPVEPPPSPPPPPYTPSVPETPSKTETSTAPGQKAIEIPSQEVPVLPPDRNRGGRKARWVRSLKVRKPVLLGSLVAAVTIALFATPLLRWADWLAYDLMFALRGALDQPDDIVVVAIDDASLEELKMPLHWPRDIHARLIEALFSAGASAVAFDIVFAVETDEAQDDRFAAAVREHPGVVLASEYKVISYSFGDSFSWITPAEKLLPPGRESGFINAPPDSVVRRIETEIDGRRALSRLAAETYVERLTGASLVADRATIPRVFLINYAGPGRAFETISYYRALDPKKFELGNVFEGKLVFVGLTTNEIEADRHATPFTRFGQGFMYGVEIHANAAHNLLEGNFLTEPNRAVMSAVSFLLAVVSGIFFFGLRPGRAGAVAAAISVVGVSSGFLLFALFDYAVPLGTLIAPTLAVFFASAWYRYAEIYRSEQRIRSMLAAQRVQPPGSGSIDGISHSTRIFVSYNDQEEDAKYMAAILDYVKGLNSDGVEFWSKRDLVTGDAKVETIQERIRDSDMALVLVSQAYLNSEDCIGIEVCGFVSRGLTIFPIILSPCDWKSQPWLEGLKVLPGRDETFAGHYRDRARRDQVLLEILEDLKKCIKKLSR